MQQYKTQYGTIFAVKEHNGAPAIMCRAEHSETWSLSSMITPFTPGAWTAEELQGQLDSWAATKGWAPVEEPASAEPPEIVDEGSEPEDGFPDWVRPMVEAFLQFDSIRGLPAFTAFNFRHSEPVQHHQGGTLADGLYDTGPKGIKFSVFRGPNSDQYREASYTWADFVRRCKAEGLAPEPPHQDKEDKPCKTETAPTGAAAATTDASVAVSTAETSTTSESGEDARSSPSAPADTSAQPPKAADAVPATPTTALYASGNGSLPAFDFGADADTNAGLISDAQIFMAGSMARVMAAKRAHDRTANHYRGSWGKWCDFVGISRDTGDNMVRVAEQFGNIQVDGKSLIDLQPLKLLYATSKPSTPPEIRQQVENLDITSYKQYQELLARYNAEHASREKAEQECDEAATHIQAARDMQIDTARERDAALQRATAAENRAAGAQKLADQRATENAELKAKLRALESRPVDIAVAEPREADKERWRKEGETRAEAALLDTVRQANQAKVDAQRQANALQEQLAAARPDADACQRTADTLYETTENLRLLLRAQLKLAQLQPKDYGNVVAHVLQAAQSLRDTVRSCAPVGYTMDDDDEEDFL